MADDVLPADEAARIASLHERCGSTDPDGRLWGECSSDCADVRTLLAGVGSLRATVGRLERELGEEVDRRDHAEEWADRLALAIADQREIGEHSNANDPWANAEEVAQAFGMDMALADKLRTAWATADRLTTAAGEYVAARDAVEEGTVSFDLHNAAVARLETADLALRAALDATTAEE